jgi:hypothetical protein
MDICILIYLSMNIFECKVRHRQLLLEVRSLY